ILFWPVITKGKTKGGGWRILIVDSGEIGLMIFLKFLVMGNVTAVAVHFPALGKHPQGNPGIVLNNDAAVLQKEIPHARESIAVHQERSGFDQTKTGPARRAPAKEGTVRAAS